MLTDEAATLESAREALARERLEELQALARTYRNWSVKELAQALGRQPGRLVPESGMPKIDLVVGLAKALDQNSMRLTSKSGGFLGTLHYTSPEQAMGRDLSAASDLYSLAELKLDQAPGFLIHAPIRSQLAPKRCPRAGIGASPPGDRLPANSRRRVFMVLAASTTRRACTSSGLPVARSVKCTR